jgi:hypothetical protein
MASYTIGFAYMDRGVPITYERSGPIQQRKVENSTHPIVQATYRLSTVDTPLSGRSTLSP